MREPQINCYENSKDEKLLLLEREESGFQEEVTYELHLESQEEGLSRQKQKQVQMFIGAKAKVCTEQMGPNR